MDHEAVPVTAEGTVSPDRAILQFLTPPPVMLVEAPRISFKVVADGRAETKEDPMSQSEETLLDVEGMSCPSCIRHIKEALDEVEGVSAVDVRLAEGRVVVKHDAQSASVAQLVDALRDAGYESAPSKAAK